jgi:dienelactone hydrolase
MIRTFIVAAMSAAVIAFAPTAFAQQVGGSPDEAKAMLMKAVAAVKEDKAKALDMFNKGEGGFLDRDLYVFCANLGDGRFVAIGNPNTKQGLGRDVRAARDWTGKRYGAELYAAMQKPEGQITEVSYMAARPGIDKADVAKVSLATRAGDDLGCAVGYYTGVLPIDAFAQRTQATSVADFYYLTKPAGKGPFPAVVLAPGCGGFHEGYSQPVFDKYRGRLIDDGFAVINVDFTRAHDIPGCADDNGSLISSEDYAKDILGAVTFLAKDSSIDPTRIHVMGWSFGGGASFSALGLAERESVKINSVVAFYPYCGGALGWKQPTPVLTLVALADNVAPFAQCKGLVKDALDNKSMRVVEYPGAHHSFDQFTIPTPITVPSFGTLGYNENAATQSWSELEAFLKR